MIVSVNPHPPLSEFQKLMFRTDRLLNADALKRPKYYATRGGNPLEELLTPTYEINFQQVDKRKCYCPMVKK